MQPLPTDDSDAAALLSHPLALLRLLRSGGRALLAQSDLHGQLLKVEWAQQKQRLLAMLLMTLLGFACVLCVMLMLAALVLSFSWETDLRLPALLGLLGFYSLGALLAWRRFSHLSALSEQAFAATRAELAADLALLRSKL